VIRIVSIRKAIFAGAAAAVAWELLLRPLLLLGLPLVDIVRMLGLVAVPEGPAWAWWIAGMAIHLLVGVIWAVFYAYFFWSVLAWRPLSQGLAFTVIPTILATLIVYPQLYLMQAAGPALHTNPVRLLASVSWGERLGIVLGHLAYGAALGLLYTRPTAYLAGLRPRMDGGSRRVRGPSPRVVAPRPPNAFIFASGIECSYPTLEAGSWRQDEMAATGHYRNWKLDLQLAVEIGVTHLRYGPPLHLVLLGPGRRSWAFSDEVISEMQALGLTPIVDLCHFGLPDWLQSFQNPEAPQALAEYAAAFASRFPWVRYYTPVNEMYVCAKLSALQGAWNEQRRDERSFVTAVRHLAKANVLMRQAILAVRPDAVFVNSESGEFFQAATPDPEIRRIAAFENARRFLPLDLIHAHRVGSGMRTYLRDNGMPDDELRWFMQQETPRRAVIGVDYYTWNEKLIDTRGRPQALGELFGWYVIALQYWERYRRPMMHTETNHLDAREAPRWLWRQWHNVQLIQKAGVPVIGFTWYSLTDQVDWDIGLTQSLGNVNPVGLFDLNRDPRPVGLAYQHLIRTFADDPALREHAQLKALLS
jgi:beta-glucosidase/6-phospho-beta-glucosidase/beta-galactosidase